MAASSLLSISTSYTNPVTSSGGKTLTDGFSDSPSYPFTGGTGANQIDKPWSDSATLINAATTYTLSALAGPGSGTTVMARVRKFYVRNLATVEGNKLTITPGATNGWVAAFAGAVTIPAGGMALFVAPLSTAYAVGSGATDQVTFTAVGSVAYIVEIEGGSV